MISIQEMYSTISPTGMLSEVQNLLSFDRYIRIKKGRRKRNIIILYSNFPDETGKIMATDLNCRTFAMRASSFSFYCCEILTPSAGSSSSLSIPDVKIPLLCIQVIFAMLLNAQAPD